MLGALYLPQAWGYECVVVLAGQGVVEMNHGRTHRQANPPVPYSVIYGDILYDLFSNIWGYIVRRAQLLIYGWQEPALPTAVVRSLVDPFCARATSSSLSSTSFLWPDLSCMIPPNLNLPITIPNFECVCFPMSQGWMCPSTFCDGFLSLLCHWQSPSCPNISFEQYRAAASTLNPIVFYLLPPLHLHFGFGLNVFGLHGRNPQSGLM